MQQNLKLLILIILLTTILFPQSKLHIKGHPKKSSSEIVAVRDANGNYCAAIKILSDMEGFKYESYNGVVKVKDNPGEDIVYLSADERVLQIYKTGYQSKKIILSEIGIQLAEKQVWEVNITGDAKSIPINIITEPEDATIYIDGERKGTGKTHKVPIGKHTLKLEKQGYNNITDEIDVSESNTLFEYTLESVEPVMITIKSNPDAANIFIDDINEGQTNKQLFRFPGEYNLRLSKNKYESIEETINVKETGNNVFTYELTKNTAMLTIETDPVDAEIYLNGSKKSSHRIEVAPGRYKIDAKKEGYYSKSRTINVDKGEERSLEFTLEPKTGKLQVVVEPMETEVILKKQGKTIESWSGSKYLRDIVVGEYKITSQLNGYQSQNKIINIDQNKTISLDIKMVKGLIENQHTVQNDSPDGLVYVKGGTYTMGNVENQNMDKSQTNKVTVNSFYISKYEVTQKQFNSIMKSNPSHFKGDKLPVENVTWHEAIEFCNKLSKQEDLVPCYQIENNLFNNKVKCNFSASGYRLPTEAEWEYAARSRGRDDRKWSGTSNENEIDLYCWHIMNSDKKSHPVGMKKPNRLGIYDMSGNVWEWCWDSYSNDSPSSQVISSGRSHAMRGGSWGNNAKSCSIINRIPGQPAKVGYGRMGFRVIRNAY